MSTTRASLLLRIKAHNDVTAWNEFYKLYAPMLYRFARARELPHEDAEEVCSQCLEIVVRKIGDFEYDKEKGAFKNWLFRIADYKVIDLLRRRREKIADTRDIRALADPIPSPAEVWERQWKNEHLKYCVARVKHSVSLRSYQVFRMLLMDECSVEEVCKRMDMNANQVYKAKSRVLRRVREILAEVDYDNIHT